MSKKREMRLKESGCVAENRLSGNGPQQKGRWNNRVKGKKLKVRRNWNGVEEGRGNSRREK